MVSESTLLYAVVSFFSHVSPRSNQVFLLSCRLIPDYHFVPVEQVRLLTELYHLDAFYWP